jgi:lysyl-tRNA synthetase class 1
VLLGQAEGPRFGGFIALYGIPETIALIRRSLDRPPSDSVTAETAGAAT